MSVQIYDKKNIDVLEDDLNQLDHILLAILLKDKTTKRNIIWATKDYEELGSGFGERSQIMIDSITGIFSDVIQPRAAKPKTIKNMRVRNRAEVFTPSWICNLQNNQIDEAWFGRKNIFNIENGNSWHTIHEKIEFPKEKNWKEYVTENRLEITCGEAPYLASRYDTVTGEYIPIFERIGLLDRKMRVVNENCETDEKWLEWSEKAIQSVYGYEFQGDNLLIARENLLYTYIDYYKERFEAEPPIKLLRKIANIIAWNIWQMDGLKNTVPFSISTDQYHQMAIDEMGKNDVHEPCFCKIKDWRAKETITFISLIDNKEK